MGMQLEFNWYLVLKQPAEEFSDGFWAAEDGTDNLGFIETKKYYQTTKDGARVYPVGGVVPLIKNDKAVAMVYIRECSQRLNAKNQTFTVIDFEIVINFKDNDVVANHYTDMYTSYKKKQEIEDHGGKFKVEDYANALERRDFEAALEKLEGKVDEGENG